MTRQKIQLGMPSRDRFDDAVSRVVSNDNCSGCGACALVNPNYVMQLDDAGFNRPIKVRKEVLQGPDLDVRLSDFRASCPGISVKTSDPEGSKRRGLMGPIVSSWEAWSNDEELRFRGSSGGALSALSAWLLESGRAARVIGAQSDPAAPSTTRSVVIGLPSQVAEIAGSRYAPASNAALSGAADFRTAFVGRPCEVSAIRQLTSHRKSEPPVLLSFFCAGVPSQRSTDNLIEALGIKRGTPLNTMRYRGHGWPGAFYAEDMAGNSVSTSYDESWGKALGPSVQWRCKLCPDGMGESADIVAGDYWRTDDRGYPVFENSEGISALIARTQRGHTLIMEAIAAGIISATPLDVGRVAAIQPLQITRRETLFGRLLGRALAGFRVPKYVGFRLLATALRNPVVSLRHAYGSYRRSSKHSRRLDGLK